MLAVDDVSISIGNGEIVGLVGESGCGKTTLGRLLLRLIPADAGTLSFDGTEIPGTPAATFRRRAQIVLQNPDTSLNPRQTVGTILRRPLQRFGLERGAAEIERLLGIVRLPPSYAVRYPHQLSGGEKQRVGIARALATRPDFLVCDEAVSALDVSVQAAVLNLLLSLRDELGLSYLFISHDIGVIAHVADRVVVMYRGSVVEEGGVQQVLRPPYHPYTELLLSSVPIIGRHRGGVSVERSTPRPDTVIEGVGCKFAARCGRKAGSICDTVAPPWQSVEFGTSLSLPHPRGRIAGCCALAAGLFAGARSQQHRGIGYSARHCVTISMPGRLSLACIRMVTADARIQNTEDAV